MARREPVTEALMVDERGYHDAKAIVRAFIQEQQANPNRLLPQDVIAEILADSDRAAAALWELGRATAQQVVSDIHQARREGRLREGATDEEEFDHRWMLLGSGSPPASPST